MKRRKNCPRFWPTNTFAHARWSAIWTLDAIDGGRAQRQSILSALHDPDATVQAQAARQLGTRAAPEAVGPLVQMLDSTNAALRFRAATALGRIGDAHAIAPLQQALTQTDLFARYAAFYALRRIGLSNRKGWTLISDGLINGDAAIREGTYFAMRETYDARLIHVLVDLLPDWRRVSPESCTNILGLVVSLYQKPPPWNGDWWNATPVYGAPPAKTAEWEGSSVAGATLCVALASGDPAVRQIAFDWFRAHLVIQTPAPCCVNFSRATRLWLGKPPFCARCRPPTIPAHGHCWGQS